MKGVQLQIDSSNLILKVLFSLLIIQSIFEFANGVSVTRRATFEGDGCKAALDLKTFSTLNQICDDCFELYKAPEIYSLCRSDCFGSKYFFGCMENLLVKEDMKGQVARYLDGIHTNYYNLIN
ncbi:crustacean hyperglycemic hormone [Lepeophtheirus salmonis]|uniref:Iontransport peptide [Bombyx mori] n=1 Tax=Lepeophtheirus salmonis TaxID=72036 RepID=A0A0K2U1F3_LEPSM|nr:CHH-like protein [Lepeophtheirus salmonis]